MKFNILNVDFSQYQSECLNLYLSKGAVRPIINLSLKQSALQSKPWQHAQHAQC